MIHASGSFLNLPLCEAKARAFWLVSRITIGVSAGYRPFLMSFLVYVEVL